MRTLFHVSVSMVYMQVEYYNNIISISHDLFKAIYMV